MNQAIFIGRLTKDPVYQSSDGKQKSSITLAIKRPFKNIDGVYDTDFITCTLWNALAVNLCEYCKKGDIISVKARIQNDNYLDKDEKMVYRNEIIAEQISYISSVSRKEDTLEISD